MHHANNSGLLTVPALLTCLSARVEEALPLLCGGKIAGAVRGLGLSQGLQTYQGRSLWKHLGVWEAELVCCINDDVLELALGVCVIAAARAVRSGPLLSASQPGAVQLAQQQGWTLCAVWVVGRQGGSM
jgi:hypothetical protein